MIVNDSTAVHFGMIADTISTNKAVEKKKENIKNKAILKRDCPPNEEVNELMMCVCYDISKMLPKEKRTD